jgi:hypothetical protein
VVDGVDGFIDIRCELINYPDSGVRRRVVSQRHKAIVNVADGVFEVSVQPSPLAEWLVWV